jgi:hypothetical protein
MSIVWNYATKRKNPQTKETEAICGRCGKVIKSNDGSTSAIASHLKKVHEIDVKSQTVETAPSKKSKTLLDFVKRQTLNEIVSDLATDGISIRAITRNNYIRQSVKRDGFTLPLNESRVMSLIHDHYEEKKIEMISHIKSLIKDEKKCTMTIDEYSTVRRRRYFGINIHCDKKTFKTGLVRIMGSCNAEKMKEVVDHHLSSYGINSEKDLVGSTQDGAAVNKKFMLLMDVIDQFCLNHGIHLGVCDTLYKKKNDHESNAQYSVDDDDENDEFSDNADLELINFNSDTDDEVDFCDVLKHARKVVKFIRCSDVRNQILQSKVKARNDGNEIELQLDVKHRWNSIITMAESLLKTKISLFETFADLKELDLINKLDFYSLQNLKDALEPVKLAVEVLSREDATLLTAQTTIDFMLDKLKEQNSVISNELMNNLKRRTDERMNVDVMNLLRSLEDPEKAPSKATIQFAGKLASRLFGSSASESEREEDENSSQLESAVTQELTLRDELNLLLQKSSKSKPSSSSVGEFKWIKEEFVLFRNTGKRTENLQKLFEAMLSIKPTSTDVERVFSVSSGFCTKIRSQLSDKSLNALVFLKYYKLMKN